MKAVAPQSFFNHPVQGHTSPTALWGLAGVLALFGLLSANPLLTAASVLVVPLFVRWLWRQGEPPVLLFIVLFQWLQVTTKVFHSNLLGEPVSGMAQVSGAPVELAISLGLVALAVLALGQRLVIRRMAFHEPTRLEQERQTFEPKRVFVLYVVFFAVWLVASDLAWRFIPLSQVVLPLASLKWVVLFVLAHVVVARGHGWGWMGLAVFAEVIVGFGAYFSDFKTVFFVLIVAMLAAPVRLSIRQRMAVVVSAILLLGFSIIWQGIKGEYRPYLSQGEAAQVVNVSWGERLAKVGALVADLDASTLAAAMESGLERIAYIDYFANAIFFVPEYAPHASGAIWGGALRHILMPRLLFMDKPVLPSDSEQTMRYTGLTMASGAEGTSISLGYVAESYIDFGLFGMWLPIFLMGLLQGGVYAFFVRRTPSLLFGFGFALVVLLNGLYFETVAIKYLGGMLSTFLVYGAFVMLAGQWFVRLALSTPTRRQLHPSSPRLWTAYPPDPGDH